MEILKKYKSSYVIAELREKGIIITPATYNHWANARRAPASNKLKALSEVLGVSVDLLLEEIRSK